MSVSVESDYRGMVTHSQINGWGKEPLLRSRRSRSPSRLQLSQIMAFFFISVGSFGLPLVQGQDGELCVVQTPLRTPYFIPYVETSNPCSGCWYPTTQKMLSADEHDPYSAVHVLQIENPIDGVVELTLDYHSEDNHDSSSSTLQQLESVPPVDSISRQVVVVISSHTYPISLVVLGEELMGNASFLFVTRPQDLVHFPSGVGDHIVETRDWPHPVDALEKTKSQFGFISSFSLAKNVNKIKLKNDSDMKSNAVEEQCSVNVSTESPIAECSLVIKKQTSGCFHETMFGVNKRDIHIIEIDSEFEKKNNTILLLISGVVTPELSLEGRIEARNAIKRNLTFVLRSSHPTIWTVRVSGLQGIVTLLVGDGDQVENKSSTGQDLLVSVKRQEFPKTFDQMFVTILTQIGPPLSYTRTESPSIIRVLVPPKQEFTITGKPKSTMSTTPFAKIPENLNNLIDGSVTVECYKSEVTISLPMWVVRRVGGILMSLRDQACQGVQNGTHVVLRSKFSECDFVQEKQDSSYLYTNFAHIEYGQHHLSVTDDEDFEGSGFGIDDVDYGKKIPTVVVQCKTNFKVQDKKKDENYPDMIKYSLKIFHDENLLRPYQSREFPVIAPADSIIYAKVEFAKEVLHRAYESDLKILIESCILSASESHVSSPVILIKKSCPFQPYVTMQKSYLNANLAFHFQLSLEYLAAEKVFLHCQIGVCSSDPLPKPSIKKCVDPESYCKKDTLMKAFSSQYVASFVDTVIVGPFLVLPAKNALSGTRNLLPSSTTVNRDTEVKTRADDGHHLYGASERKAQIIVMEGLSTEIVVGIAIASFIIGVCLTATLWIIYLKTDPRRQKRSEAVMPRNSAYDLSAHSGSSTPSSQEPMTA